MSTSSDLKQERINLRLRPQAKQLLERAASFEGKTVSNFILSSAMARAERTIEEHERISLSVSEAHAFYAALEQPLRWNKKLAAALEEHDHRVTAK
ncbi:MAG: type II toxin-antitoxin system TacA family antitoxin [Wenzhouxiangella sp.]